MMSDWFENFYPGEFSRNEGGAACSRLTMILRYSFRVTSMVKDRGITRISTFFRIEKRQLER